MSRTKPLSAALLLGLCATLLSLAPGSSGAGMGPGSAAVVDGALSMDRWKAVAATGMVESRPPAATTDPWSAVRRGDLLEPESAVRTQKRSRTTLARNGDVILVDPASEIVLPAVASGKSTVIRQGSGNALYRIEPSPERSVSVETPWLVAGVKGTVFSVIVEPAWASVSVASGRVEVRCLATGEVAGLGPGDMVVFDAEMRVMEVYRERREGAREVTSEISRSAKESLDTTVDLLEEASASLDRTEMGGLAIDELVAMDLSVWKLERDLRELDLDSTLKEDGTLLSSDGDQGLLDRLGLKSP